MPRKEAKVTIDSRFARMFTDKDFAASAAPVDKRGRPRKEGAVNPMQHYYLQQDGEEEEGRLKLEEEEEVEEGSDESESDETTTTTTDEEEDDDDRFSVNSDLCRYLMANHDDTPMIKNETHRLAVVNLDWDHIKAVDLYVVMTSCLPKGGQIHSVAVYPSEFGLKCMEIEAIHGPSGLFEDNDDNSEDDSDVDDNKLRPDELNKLRYYNAVVVCDSSATANHLYKTLDGTEFLKTSNVFDLRSFPIPWSSNIRLVILQPRRKFNPNQLDEFNEYLDSTDESDEDDDEYNNQNGVRNDDEAEAMPNGETKKRLGREKLLALLQAGDDSDSDKSNDKDLEITFNTELEDLSKRILKKKTKNDENSDSDKEEASQQDDDDFFVEEPLDSESSKQKKGLKGKKGQKGSRKDRDESPEREEREANRAELELLFADDQDVDQGPKGFNLKPKKVKSKKGKEKSSEDKLPNVDLSNDPRFAELFSSHLFALDPTDPEYKSAAYIRKRAKKQGKDSQEEEIPEDNLRKSSKQDIPPPVEGLPNVDTVPQPSRVSLEKNELSSWEAVQCEPSLALRRSGHQVTVGVRRSGHQVTVGSRDELETTTEETGTGETTFPEDGAEDTGTGSGVTGTGSGDDGAEETGTGSGVTGTGSGDDGAEETGIGSGDDGAEETGTGSGDDGAEETGTGSGVTGTGSGDDGAEETGTDDADAIFADVSLLRSSTSPALQEIAEFKREEIPDWTLF
uniref:Uncharacterized protein n=1 Tax=Ananas comosus var. bracteatus TaxID=296719 RepID=A0A6V7NL17_ANACO|nr:unnamed protein product [Ananas comosus var. bracteatus]